MPTFAVVFFTLAICTIGSIIVECSEHGVNADMGKVVTRTFWQLVSILVFLAFKHAVV